MWHDLWARAASPRIVLWCTCALLVAGLSGCHEPDPRAIPGLSVGMIEDAFEDKGFKAADPQESGGMHEWRMERRQGLRQFLLIIRGPHHKDVVSIEAVAAIPSGQDVRKEAIAFFEQVATFPFDAAAEINAREWVTFAYDTGGSTVIGGIQLKIKGAGLRQTLTMTRANAGSESL